MIYDLIQNADKYLGIHPSLDLALRDLQAAEHLSATPDGKVTRGESDYETVKENAFETHLRKADIHVVTAGEEKVLYAPCETLTEFVRKESDDYIGSNGKPFGEAILKPGMFIVLFPFEAHAVHLCTDKPAPVHKIVYKILMKE